VTVRKEVAPPLAAAQLHVTVSDHAASHPDGPCHGEQGDAGDLCRRRLLLNLNVHVGGVLYKSCWLVRTCLVTH
jgi:hypothetical protein